MIRNTQLCFVFLNFPFVCQDISACLKLNRPQLVIVYNCYLGTHGSALYMKSHLDPTCIMREAESTPFVNIWSEVLHFSLVSWNFIIFLTVGISLAWSSLEFHFHVLNSTYL